MSNLKSSKKSKRECVNVYFHKNCSDGFGAAWAANKYFGSKARYIPVSHDDELVFSDNSINYFLDFSPKEKYILDLEKKSKEIYIIDHHISSYEYLKDKKYYTFNLNNSGCVLAWKHFFPNKEVPVILKYIEDRDLWNNSLDYTNEIFLYINLFSHTYEEWDLCNKELSENFSQCVSDGKTLFKYRDNLVDMISKNSHIMKIGGYRVSCINSPLFQSYMLSRMYENEDFMASYYYDGERYIFSLRSSKDSPVDVSKISKVYNGGGHKNAAGFSVKSLNMLSILYYKSLLYSRIKYVIRPIKRCLQYIYRKL